MKQSKRPKAVEQPSVSHVSDKGLRQFVGYNMKRAFNAVHSDLVTTLLPFELRMVTYTALVLIKDNPGLRQSQLADALAVERPNLVMLIDELERRELITRTPVLTDRRANALQITLAGRRLCDKATDALHVHEEKLLASVDPDARKAMLQTLYQIETGKTE